MIRHLSNNGAVVDSFLRTWGRLLDPLIHSSTMLHSPGKIKHTHKQINVKDAAEGQYEAFNTHRCYMRLNDDESVAAASGYTRCYQPCYCRYPCVILCAGPPLPWRRNHPISSNSGRIHFTSYDTSRQQRVSTDDWDAPRDSFFFSSCFVDSLPPPPQLSNFHARSLH